MTSHSIAVLVTVCARFLVFHQFVNIDKTLNYTNFKDWKTFLVQEAGLEPARACGPEDFKSALATYYNIPATFKFSH